MLYHFLIFSSSACVNLCHFFVQLLSPSFLRSFFLFFPKLITSTAFTTDTEISKCVILTFVLFSKIILLNERLGKLIKQYFFSKLISWLLTNFGIKGLFMKSKIFLLFSGKFGQKNQNCQFKIKPGI